MNTLKDVYSKWENDIAFRNAFKKNPQQALQDFQIELTEDDLKKAKKLFVGEELDKKISK